MGVTLEKEYTVLISIMDIGGEGTKGDVLNSIDRKGYLILSQEDLKEKDNRKELKWRNDLAFTRKHLQSKGYIDGKIKDNWKITEKGKEYLKDISDKILREQYIPIKLTEQAINRANQYMQYNTVNINYLIKEQKEDYSNITWKNFPEGKEKQQLHKYKERNPKVIREAKNRFKKINGRLYCEICGFDFEAIYGDIGRDYIEGHHIIPVSELREGDVTNIKDILLVCANCHRILHKKRPCVSKEELLKLVQ